MAMTINKQTKYKNTQQTLGKRGNLIARVNHIIRLKCLVFNQKSQGRYIQNAKRKTVNQESYIQQSCPSDAREKLRHSQIMREFTITRPDMQKVLDKYKLLLLVESHGLQLSSSLFSLSSWKY